MENKRIYLCLAHMSEAGEELKYIKEAFDTNWVVPLGPNVDAFEKELENYVNSFKFQDSSSKCSKVQGSSETCNMKPETLAKRVVALSSGTAAVHLALLALGVGLGDEVLTQSFTFCASANPIVYLGATPVFVDSETDTWNMDPALLDEAIADRIAKTGRKPKAIVPVTLYGMPYKIEEIMAVARRYDIPVVEDAAEGLGSRYGGQVMGTFGDYGVLSFNGNKMITTSGGGALICPSAEARERVLWYATQAREAYPYYQHEAIGYNYRLSNVCAGIGRGQMTVLDEHIAHHRHIAQLYQEAFADVEGIEFHREPHPRPLPEGEGSLTVESNYWLSTILLDENLKVKGEEQAYTNPIQGAIGGAAGVVHSGDAVHTDCEPNRNVEALRMALNAEGIESRPLWKPMHKQPVYCRTSENGKMESEIMPSGIIRQTSAVSVAYVNGVSERIFRRGLCLPSGPMVSDADVERIICTIKNCIVC